MTTRPGVGTGRVQAFGQATGPSRIPWFDLIILSAAGLIALRFLARIWSVDSNYAFGWGVPFLAAYLFVERWPQHPDAHSSERTNGLLLILLLWGSAYFVARLFLEVVPGWRPGLWLLASLFVAALVAWGWLYGGRAWVRHFSFPIAFLLCGVPWLYNLESPLTQGLARWNATLVADSLLLADIPAQAAGSTLLLSTGQLGIEEACSGLRSLQGAWMMSLFLGAFYRFTIGIRAWLVLLAIALALLGNYLRLLFLAEKGAREGIRAVAAIHESAGAGILVFTIAGLWMVCLFLVKHGAAIDGRTPAASPRNAGASHPTATRWAVGILLITLFSEAATEGWFEWRERSAPLPNRWTAQWPENIPGYRRMAISPATHELLGDVCAKSGAWNDDQGWRWNALWFIYSSRAPDRLSADVHNPEVCLRSAGWRETAKFPPFAFASRDTNLSARGYLFSSERAQEYVFWISSLNRLEADGSASSHGGIIYSRGSFDFLRRALVWEDDIWRGIRVIDAQTLEVSIAGPPDYADAQRAFIAFAGKAIQFSPPHGDRPGAH